MLLKTELGVFLILALGCVRTVFCKIIFFFLLKVLQPAPHQVITNLPEAVRLPTTRPTRPPPPLIPSSKTTVASEKPSFILGGSISQVKTPSLLRRFLLRIAFCH